MRIQAKLFDGKNYLFVDGESDKYRLQQLLGVECLAGFIGCRLGIPLSKLGRETKIWTLTEYTEI